MPRNSVVSRARYGARKTQRGNYMAREQERNSVVSRARYGARKTQREVTTWPGSRNVIR